MSRTKCMMCGAAMEQARERLPYGAGGLDHVILENVPVWRCTGCGEEEIGIPAIERLHQVLAQALARKPGHLAPSEIRFLRTWLGHSSRDFAKVMGVTHETVSRWESRTTPKKMGPTAERLLRLMVQTGQPLEGYPGHEPDGDGDLTVTRTRQGWRVAA